MSVKSLKQPEVYIFLLLGLCLIVLLKFLIGTSAVIQIAVLVCGLLFLFISAIKWKLSLFFFFIWLVLEGIFRKWITPGYASPIFFVKYFILAGPFLQVFFKGNKISKRDYPFFSLLLLYVAWGVLELFNFRGTDNLMVHALGFIVHFSFIPLMFLVPQLLNTSEKIFQLFRIIAYVSLPIFVLGAVQYFSPISSPINQYVGGAVPDATLGGEYIRITSVFSYITTYTAYLGLSMFVIFYLILMGKTGRFETLILYVIGALGIANMFMTGSRGLVFTFFGQLLLLLFILFRSRLIRYKRFFIRLAFSIIVIASLLSFTDTGERSFSAFRERVETKHDVAERIKDSLYPFEFIGSAGLFGYGIGTAYQGAEDLVETWGTMPRNFEDEGERIVLELGLVGFIILSFLRFYIFYFSWSVYKRIKSYELKTIALIVLLLQLPLLLGLSNVVYNYIQSIVYWLCVGLIVALNRIEREYETEAARIPSK